MRIGLISTSRVPSRTANSIELMKVCQALVDLDHEICLWLPDRDPVPDWHDLKARYGIRDEFPIRRIRSLPPLRGYDFALRSVIAGRRWGCDVLYVWPYQAAAAASVLGLPTILELHDDPPGSSGRRLYRAFLKGRGAVRILPTTSALQERAQQLAGAHFPPGFSIISPNGVNLEAYETLPDANALRSSLGWPQAFTVGYTGHLYSGRGLDLLIELAKRHPDVQFVWAGGEPETVLQWKQKLTARGITNTRLLGFIPNAELPAVQAACDVLVMPYERTISVSSGGDTARYASPMKAFEYLAAGRTILSSDLPVVREVLNPENAVLLPPEDVHAWDQALHNVMQDESLRQALGAQACRDAQGYTWLAREQRALAGLERFSQNDQ